MHILKNTLTLAIFIGMTSNVIAAGNQGKVHLFGTIEESPCDMAASEINKEVNMGQVSASNLNSGIPSGMTPFTLTLTNCNSATLKTTSTSFNSETGPTGIANSFAVKRSGINIADVGLILTDMQNSTSVTGGPVVKANIGISQTWTPFNGNHILKFGAYLQGKDTGTVSAGSFDSNVNFRIEYL